VKIITSFSDIDKTAKQACVALGNFDGMHKGHQHILSHVEFMAKRFKSPTGLVTFSPHPRNYFETNAEPFLLTTEMQKTYIAESLGVMILYRIPFTSALTAMSPKEFIEQVLVDQLNVRSITVGENFRFGKERLGTVETLKQFGSKMNFSVYTIPNHTLDDGQVCSSTKIRNALRMHEPEKAAAFLGRWHSIEGVVQKGEMRGTSIGFPTANLSIEHTIIPGFGVYAVLFTILDGPQKGTYKAVANLGTCPTFSRNRTVLEVHIPEFSKDIYGCPVSVALCHFLREEKKFLSVESLISQLHKDTEQAITSLTRNTFQKYQQFFDTHFIAEDCRSSS
jgi:riboflavin kinase/FMN adenylyltransferase